MKTCSICSREFEHYPPRRSVPFICSLCTFTCSFLYSLTRWQFKYVYRRRDAYIKTLKIDRIECNNVVV